MAECFRKQSRKVPAGSGTFFQNLLWSVWLALGAGLILDVVKNPVVEIQDCFHSRAWSAGSQRYWKFASAHRPEIRSKNCEFVFVVLWRDLKSMRLQEEMEGVFLLHLEVDFHAEREHFRHFRVETIGDVVVEEVLPELHIGSRLGFETDILDLYGQVDARKNSHMVW